MKNYTWLYFDLDNTLLDFNASSKLSFFAIFKDEGIHFDSDDYAEYKKISLAKNPIYVPGAKEFIEKIKTLYKLAIITNGLPEVQKPRLQLTGMDKIFDPIVISGELGHAKPDERFFSHVHQLTGRPMKEDVLVIGDSLNSHIGGGNYYGFDTCWFNYGGIENKTEYHANYEVSSIAELEALLI